MRIGSFIVIVLSLIATAFSVAVTAVGWERILFYTGWMSSSFVYPASILLYILLFGLAMMLQDDHPCFGRLSNRLHRRPPRLGLHLGRRPVLRRPARRHDDRLVRHAEHHR